MKHHYGSMLYLTRSEALCSIVFAVPLPVVAGVFGSLKGELALLSGAVIEGKSG
jgi:hypothetical protein